MRYLIKFSKESEIKFIGHLDLMRTIQRMLKRSELPIEYSKGFNPHINVSLAQPLSVGAYSVGGYMEASFEEALDENLIKETLNKVAPMGIKIFEVTPIKDVKNQKLFKSMAAIDGAEYTITMKYNDVCNLNEDMEKLLETKEWVTIKKTKSGESEADIRPLVKNIKYTLSENGLQVFVFISCGSRENLSAELLAKFIQSKTRGSNEDSFIDIRREEMYALKNKKFIPLYKFPTML